MEVHTRAIVHYVCKLDDEDAEKVRKYAKKTNCNLKEAVSVLFFDHCVIDLYHSDEDLYFSTTDILSVEDEDEE